MSYDEKKTNCDHINGPTQFPSMKWIGFVFSSFHLFHIHYERMISFVLLSWRRKKNSIFLFVLLLKNLMILSDCRMHRLDTNKKKKKQSQRYFISFRLYLDHKRKYFFTLFSIHSIRQHDRSSLSLIHRFSSHSLYQDVSTIFHFLIAFAWKWKKYKFLLLLLQSIKFSNLHCTLGWLQKELQRINILGDGARVHTFEWEYDRNCKLWRSPCQSRKRRTWNLGIWVLLPAFLLEWYVFNLIGSCVEIHRLVPVVLTVIVNGNRADIMAHGWIGINYTITEKKNKQLQQQHQQQKLKTRLRYTQPASNKTIFWNCVFRNMKEFVWHQHEW